MAGRGYLLGMGERTKPQFPHPGELNDRVYAAFMGHGPIIGPPPVKKHGRIDRWASWLGPRFESYYQRFRRFCMESLQSPAARARLLPLLSQARKRWREAGERFISTTLQGRPTLHGPGRTRPAPDPRAGQLNSGRVHPAKV